MSLFDSDATQPTQPPGLSYREDFISGPEERRLLALIESMPLRHAAYKQYTARRRVLNFGSSYDFDANELRDAPGIPQAFEFVRARVAAWVGRPPGAFTQLLVADYAPGTPLGWHRDVPDYEIVAGVSLGTTAVLRFRPYPHTVGVKALVRQLEVRPRSVYAMQGPARWEWQHSVPPTPGRRWSLTFRTRT